jgi:hypothetical protein
MQISKESFKQFIIIANDMDIYLGESKILKLIDTTNLTKNELEYLEKSKKKAKEYSSKMYKNQKKVLDTNIFLEKEKIKTNKLLAEVKNKNKELEKKSESFLSHELEMEKLKATHTLKLSSLKIILFPIFLLIGIMLFLNGFKLEISATVITLASSIFGVIVGTILAGVLGVQKDRQFQQDAQQDFNPCEKEEN